MNIYKILRTTLIKTQYQYSIPQIQSLNTFIYSKFSKFNCDSCSKHIETPQCKACDRMVNYFRIFNIPENYKIDPKTVRDMAKDLQKQFHPDKFNQSDSQSLQLKMEKYSTYINEAKATLLNDLQRAIYLMQLKGVELKQQIETKDSKFMMDIFEINQEIESSSIKQAEQIKRRIEGILKGLQKDLEDFFQSDDLQKCQQFVVKYKYLHSALVNVKQKIANLLEKTQNI